MILNLTQHQASLEQKKAGVTEPASKDAIKALLTFNAIPSPEELHGRADALAEIAEGTGVISAMIGGAPFFMGYLEDALRARRITPLYAFSERVVEENSEGRKVSIFKHLGFIEARKEV